MNASWMSRMIGTAVLGLATLAVAAQPAQAMEPSVGKAKLEQLAKAAATAAQHAEVARHYRVWAEALDKKAVEHEETATKLARRPLPAMAHKWPAMVSNPATKEKQLALQSRRAAQEAREISQKHIGLAVEIREAE